MRESVVKIKHKRVGRAKDRKAIKYLLGFLVVGLIAASAYVVIRSLFAEESVQVRAEPDSQLDLERLTDKEYFKEAYLKENGGIERLESLQTLRVEGRIVTKGQEVGFVTIKRRPDMMLLTQKFGRARITYGSSGGEFWKRESRPGQKEVVTDVEDDEINSLAGAVEMFSPILLTFLEGTDRIKAIELSEWQDREVLRVKMSFPETDAFDYFYVEPDRLEVLARITRKTEEQPLIREFSNYKKVDGVNVPFLTVVKQGDEVLNRVVLEGVGFNVGASSILFERGD